MAGRMIALAACAGFTLLTGVAPAYADGVRVSPTNPRITESVTVSTAAGCGERALVKSSAFAASVRLDGSVEDPTQSAQAVISTEAAPGPHTISISCANGTRTAIVHVRDASTGPETGGGGMALTAQEHHHTSPVGIAALLTAALLILGAGTTLAIRRNARRRP